MLRHRLVALISGVCLFALSPALCADDDIIVIRAHGEGISKDAALKDSLRRAIEQVNMEIFSKTKVQDFALESDVVISRASGLVKDYKILNEVASQGLFGVDVEARISKKLMDATWGDVAILLKQLGRPKIMVLFTEIIHDLDRKEPNREIVQFDSILGTAIERKLLNLGFKLVNPSQMKEIDKKKAEIAVMNNDMATLRDMATRYDAQVYIKGTARASGPEHTTAAGINLNMWETDVTIQGFWTETADEMFSNTMTGMRGGSRVAGPAGARQTLEKTGQKLAEASVSDLLESWTRGTAGGQGDVIIEVVNVADARQSITIKKALETLKGVEEVVKEGAKGNVKYTLQTHLSADNVTEQLVDLKFNNFTLDVENQKAKTIACKVK